MPQPIKSIKQYEILSLLGKGGMGEVYLARDTMLDRNVAIKFLPEAVHKSVKAQERFLREAKAAAGLDHPFICKIYEAGDAEGKSYIVMEYVEGRTLKDRIAADPLTLKESLQICLEISEALEVAHKKGIVHRDLKPSNLMCTPQGHVKVMDFGLAKHVQTEEEPPEEKSSMTRAVTETMTQPSITGEGTVVGTVAYMSPEQARGEKVDSRSDIFSLGIIFAEMALGRHPFRRESTADTLSAVIRDNLPAVNIRPKIVNPMLSRILHKALAKGPSDRYREIGEFAADVRALLARVSPGPWPLLSKVGALAGGIALLAVAGYLLFRPDPTPGPAPKPVSVLVADFENRTGDPLFDGVLEQTFILGLEQAPYMNISSRSEARTKAVQLDPDSDGRFDLRLAQLICRSSGIPVAIEGVIEKTGEIYTFEARAVDPSNGKEMAREPLRRIKKKTDIPQAVIEAGVRLSSKLGGMTEEAVENITRETFTTSSLEAMKAYVRAQELAKAGNQPEAISEYEKAIAEDPGFGRAYAGLAVIFYNRGDRQKGLEYHEKALALLDRMTDREKYRTRSIWYLMTGNYQKAVEECGALIEQFPADSAGTANLALAYFLARDMANAVEFGKRRLELGEYDTSAHYNLAWYYLGAGEFESAENEALKVIEKNPQYTKSYVILALAGLARGEVEQAAEYYDNLASLGDLGRSLSSAGLADIAMYEGRWEDALTILEEGIEQDLQAERAAWAARKMAVAALAMWKMGKKTDALAAADRAVGTHQAVAVLFPAAGVYLQAGSENRARALADTLAHRIESDPRAYAKIITAEILRQKGRYQEAIPIYREAQQIVDTWNGRFMLGRAYLDAGAYAAAHSEFETCFKRRGEAASLFLDDWPSFHYFPEVHYYLGRAQEGLKIAGAKDSYRTFLKMKERAGEDALVEDAKTRLQNLT